MLVTEKLERYLYGEERRFEELQSCFELPLKCHWFAVVGVVVLNLIGNIKGSSLVTVSPTYCTLPYFIIIFYFSFIKYRKQIFHFVTILL